MLLQHLHLATLQVSATQWLGLLQSISSWVLGVAMVHPCCPKAALGKRVVVLPLCYSKEAWLQMRAADAMAEARALRLDLLLEPQTAPKVHP